VWSKRLEEGTYAMPRPLPKKVQLLRPTAQPASRRALSWKRNAEPVFDRAIKGIETEDIEVRLGALDEAAQKTDGMRRRCSTNGCAGLRTEPFLPRMRRDKLVSADSRTAEVSCRNRRPAVYRG
jgi:hypothetical protein